jgi:sugar phosphate isomerase/epimerase
MTLRRQRRQFLAASVAAYFGTHWAKATAAPEPTICVFTEPFNTLSFDELAAAIAELGFHGIEAPVRQGGHIEPADAPQRLQELTRALAKRNLEITVMATDIHRADDPLTEKILRKAASLGIQRYRMKYLKYDDSRSVADQIVDWQAQFRDLATLNREIGIRGIYQNHAGDGLLGAALWDLDRVLDTISPEEIGVAYDIRHATVEGGTSWPTTFRMIRPRIDSIYVKDFQWHGSEAVNVPLGQGRVNRQFFAMLKESGFTGPIALHEEYLRDYSREQVPKHLAAMKADLATLKKMLA